jgi:hypothetical protein
MTRDQFGARQQSQTFHGGQHRQIGLRAVAAAVLYQGSSAEEHTVPHERSVPPVPAAPLIDSEP